jgi:hypothetical protein
MRPGAERVGTTENSCGSWFQKAWLLGQSITTRARERVPRVPADDKALTTPGPIGSVTPSTGAAAYLGHRSVQNTQR